MYVRKRLNVRIWHRLAAELCNWYSKDRDKEAHCIFSTTVSMVKDQAISHNIIEYLSVDDVNERISVLCDCTAHISKQLWLHPGSSVV